MKIFKLECRQTLPISLDKAWAYFSNPLNLSEITPPDLGLKIKGQFDAKTSNGMIIQYTVKPLLGLEMDWVSEIKHVREPYMFVDEQRVGPYKLWYHQHMFKPIDSDTVEVIDVVYYALPGGFLAPLLNALIVRKKLEGIFNFRKQVLDQKFKGR